MPELEHRTFLALGPLPRAVAIGWAWLVLGCLPAGSADPPVPAGYVATCYVTPCAITGDFDGDGRADRAVLIADGAKGRRGVLIRLAGVSQPFILGAGTEFGNGGDDFSWLEQWRLVPRGLISPGAWETPPPNLVGDALEVGKPGSASALVYWQDGNFHWYQLGD